MTKGKAGMPYLFNQEVNMSYLFGVIVDNLVCEIVAHTQKQLEANIRQQLQATADEAVNEAVAKLTKDLQARAEAYRSPMFEGLQMNVGVFDKRPPAKVQELEDALALLLDDVESAVDMGTPFENPENGFHKSVMAARRALGQ